MADRVVGKEAVERLESRRPRPSSAATGERRPGAPVTGPTRRTFHGRGAPVDVPDRADLLCGIRMLFRRSLDRVRFWNICAASDAVPCVTRDCAHERRTEEADHRGRLRDARYELIGGGRAGRTGGYRGGLLVDLRQRMVESELLTEALGDVLSMLDVEQFPRGFETLRNRSAWFDSVIRGRTGVGT